MTIDAPFLPDWLCHPGENIADALEESGLNQLQAAERLGMSKKHLNDLIKGRADISAETAHKLSLVFGSTPEFWLRLQMNYDAERIRHQREEELAATHKDWVEQFPYAAMAKLGAVDKLARTTRQRMMELLRFLAIATPDQFATVYQGRFQAAFRTSTTLAADRIATIAWLRIAERNAQQLHVGPFDKKRFRKLIPELRALCGREDFGVAFHELVEQCAGCGVAVVIVPNLKGTRASGATFPLPDKSAVLVLSARYLRDDHLWFSFFHEAAHLVLHDERLCTIEGLDGLDPTAEEEANAFARNLLIPPAHATRLPTLTNARAIRAFASELGIAPGVVVGRMQHDKLIEHSWHNGLCRKFEVQLPKQDDTEEEQIND